MQKRMWVGVGVLVACLPLAVWAADTLVVSEGGKLKPGLAKSWSQNGDATVFVLADGVDAQKTATTLRERLAQVKVTVDGNKLSISGVPQAALLDQLSGLSLAGDADPLAALAGLGGGQGSGESVEGGGSIRASKPTPLAGFPIAKDHDPSERFDAEVVEVVRGAFPQATLKLKVKKAAKTSSLKTKLAAGKTFELAVVLTGPQAGVVDLKDAGNQRNAAAYYLVKGDKLTVHAIEPKDGQLAVDWLERKP